MDLLSIAEILWRRKIVTIPVIVLTALAAFYVVKVKPPIYQAQSSLLMVPPSPPTAAQIAANPQLAKINPNNPYINYGDLSVVADTLIDTVTDSSNQQALVAKGADPRYELTLSTDYGNPPIIDITGIGRTPQIAMRSAQLVTEAAEADLVTLQTDQGVNTLYMIKGTQLVTPSYASQSVSGKLRTLIAVLAAGVLMLFVAVSLIEAVDRRRREKAAARLRQGRMPERGRPRAGFLSRYRTSPGWEPSAAPGAGAAGVPAGAARGAPGGGGSAGRGGAHSGAPGPVRSGAPGVGPGADRQHVPAPSGRPGPADRFPVRPSGRPESRSR